MAAVAACLPAAAALLAAAAPMARAATLRLSAFDADGKPLSTAALLEHIARRDRKGRASPATSAVFVTDLDGNPVEGHPWWVMDSTQPSLSWTNSSRVVVSLPWPVRGDGFSTVFLDKDGMGYADGDSVILNEEIASTQHRLFKESLAERANEWEPKYVPGPRVAKLQRALAEAMAKARAAAGPAERARLFEAALSELAVAWGKALYEHGAQAAKHPRLGPSLRWGLTLDETLLDRLGDYERIMKALERSGANWVRLVFRLNAADFTYEAPRSRVEYDRVISDLAARKVHVMGSVLDSSLWPRGLKPASMARRTSNLVLHFKDRVRSWEVASEPNGTCLGGCRSPLPEAAVLEAVSAAAAEVKRIDPGLETVATLYWWEGTAGDTAHPTFPWLKRVIPRKAFGDVDIVGLSVYPDDNPMGMAFDPVFRKLARYFPDKRVMLGAYGYVQGSEMAGYWWMEPEAVWPARSDLINLFTGAACAAPRPAGGGFWWAALPQMLAPSREAAALLRVYQRTVWDLGR